MELLKKLKYKKTGEKVSVHKYEYWADPYGKDVSRVWVRDEKGYDFQDEDLSDDVLEEYEMDGWPLSMFGVVDE